MLEQTVAPRSPSASDALAALARAIGDVRTVAHSSPDAVTATLRAADELNALAVGMIARGAGGVGGLPTEMAVRLDARRARWDARELCAAADQLTHMPATRAALEDGTISWSQARAICRTARDVGAEGRTQIDRTVGAHADRLARAEPEALIERVEDVAASARADRALRREDRAIERSFLALQPRLGGGGMLYGEADTESFATIAGALDAAAERPTSDPADPPSSRAHQRMDALVAICESSLGGGGNNHMRPRPRLLAIVDMRELMGLGLSEGARVLANVVGRPAHLTPMSTGVLACDAEVIPVVLDGGRPVAVGDARTPVTRKVRRALIARDQGCRFPGCGMPMAWTDAHHIDPMGPSTEDNLLLLCRRCHRRVHRYRWRIRLRADRTIEFRWRGKIYLSPSRRE